MRRSQAADERARSGDAEVARRSAGRGECGWVTRRRVAGGGDVGKWGQAGYRAPQHICFIFVLERELPIRHSGAG